MYKFIHSPSLRRLGHISIGVAGLLGCRYSLVQADSFPEASSGLALGERVTLRLDDGEDGIEVTGVLDRDSNGEVYVKEAFLDGKSADRVKPLLSLFRCYSDLSKIDLKEIFLESVGEPNTKNHMFYYRYPTQEGSKTISPWHDIPLWVEENKYVNFICEIPKYSRKKWEIATNIEKNPIKQDIRKDGLLREYEHGDMLFNYGALPQTWESPHHKFEQRFKGDNDPLDALEIGVQKMGIGEVKAVKVLGVYAMIDSGEIDYKLIVIRRDDPFADQLNSIEDIERILPGILKDIHNWLKLYKVKEGKEVNKFGWADKAYGAKMAFNVIRQTHHYWQREFMMKTSKILQQKSVSKARLKASEID